MPCGRLFAVEPHSICGFHLDSSKHNLTFWLSTWDFWSTLIMLVSHSLFSLRPEFYFSPIDLAFSIWMIGQVEFSCFLFDSVYEGECTC
jgi:hypothetical protein